VASDISVSTDRKLLSLNDPHAIAEWLLGEGLSSHGLI
jgi:hypothetical protein